MTVVVSLENRADSVFYTGVSDQMAVDAEPLVTSRPSLAATRAAVAAVSFGVLSSVFLGLRVLGAGYGADNDTWLMLGTWDVLVDQGRYVPSRFQGYPLAEIVIGAAAEVGGHWLSGAVSVALGVGSTVLLYDLLARRCPNRLDRVLLTSVLVVTPLFVIAATTSIDYLYGLAFFLGGWVAFERGTSRVACGLLFGLAAASRISFLPLAIVFLVMQPARDERRSDDRPLAVVALLGVTALAYLPLAIYSGMDPSVLGAERPTGQGINGVFGRAFVKSADVLGTVGSIVALVVVIVAVAAAKSVGRRIFRESWLPVALGVQLLLWLWLPVEPSYLLPALVLGLVALAPHVQGPAVRGLLVVLVVAVASSGWLNVRFLEFRYASVYGDGSCEPTEATGASLDVGVDRGLLLEYPDEVQRLETCNVEARLSQLTRTAP